jgi:hypothetical protein
MAYSSPVPDLLGMSNVSSEQVFWEGQSHGLLTDGSYGLQDIHIKTILTYGKAPFITETNIGRVEHTYYIVFLAAVEDGWMSWKRKGLDKPVELIFKFDSPRRFSKVNIFTANLIHLNIQVYFNLL